MYTLNKGRNPANLDAFLNNTEAKEAVFCEMKMLEWLGKPGTLKEAYLDSAYYFDLEASAVFEKIARCLVKSMNKDHTYASVFNKYDAWQMFKHTLAIYNYTSFTTRDSVSRKNVGSSMAGEFERVTLANVVFEMDETLISDEKLRMQYQAVLRQEQTEAERFIQAMLDPGYGLKDLFKRHCNVEFDIIYIPVAKFVAFMDKTDEEKRELCRYCCY